MQVKREKVKESYTNSCKELESLLEKYNIDDDDVLTILKTDLPSTVKADVLEASITNRTLFQLLRFEIVD